MENKLPSDAEPQSSRRQRWETNIVKLGPGARVVEVMNELGEQGWEPFHLDMVNGIIAVKRKKSLLAL